MNELAQWVADGRSRSIEMVDDIADDDIAVPYIPTLNPLLWEVAHAAYFAEHWVLRQGAGQPPFSAEADDLFDSATIGHETRWRLPVPDRAGVYAYVRDVRDRVVALLESGEADEKTLYYARYAVFHDDMHAEALTYARQTLGHPAPKLTGIDPRAPEAADPVAGDATFSGGPFVLGASREAAFVFDNEKWGHETTVAPFAMARTAVTEDEFAAFVDDGGYEKRELWTQPGWRWVQAEVASAPRYWRRSGRDGWTRRHFDRWGAIAPRRAMIHVCWFEADAYCRWAGRRLPTEAEWELAATAGASAGGKRSMPWGDEAASNAHGNLDWQAMGAASVDAFAAGDSNDGVRQLIGNVWEWTSSTFLPYPGFVADMYTDYSQTSFATRKVLRGGCWATRARMMRSTWRNFYQPSRRDVFAGFRTCAL